MQPHFVVLMEETDQVRTMRNALLQLFVKSRHLYTTTGAEVSKGKKTINQRKTLPTRQIMHNTTPYYKVVQALLQYYKALLQYHEVLPSITPVLFRTTLYYKVLLQYYSVLQRPTPYYKVLQSTTPGTTKDYSILQTTTPVLVCITKYFFVLQTVLQSATKYYSTTTLYYKDLFRTSPYYKVLVQVLQGTIPYHKVLLQCDSVSQTVSQSTTKYYSSIALYYKVFLRTTRYYSRTTV